MKLILELLKLTFKYDMYFVNLWLLTITLVLGSFKYGAYLAYILGVLLFLSLFLGSLKYLVKVFFPEDYDKIKNSI